MSPARQPPRNMHALPAIPQRCTPSRQQAKRKPSPLRLFFVAHEHSGINADLIVWSPSARAAIYQWHLYYGFPDVLPDEAFAIDTDVPNLPRPLPWHSSQGLRSVWRRS
jgi:hypothetical protein